MLEHSAPLHYSSNGDFTFVIDYGLDPEHTKGGRNTPVYKQD